MKLIKEVAFRCFIILVMLSLTFTAYDMSKPILLSEKEIAAQDVVECIVQPFSRLLDDKGEEISELPAQDFNFLWNILLPIIFYLAAIGGFLYLIIEDFKIIKTFACKNKLAKLSLYLWLAVLIVMLTIPIFFGFQLLMKGFVLSVIATAIFLIFTGILYWLSCKYKQKKP